MRVLISVALFGGAIIIMIGIVGTFARITNNDGALAISGAMLITAAMVSRAIYDKNLK